MVGEKVYELIHHQAQLWESCANDCPAFQGSAPYLFIGSGTSYYLAKVASAYAMALGLSAQAAPTAEAFIEPDLWAPRFKTAVIISRSGTTTEAVLAAQRLAERHQYITALTCHRDSPLAEIAHQVYAAEGSDDDTVVMLRSFTSMLTLIQRIINQTAGMTQSQPLSQHFSEVFRQSSTMVESIAKRTPRRVYVLGGGIRQGIADEGVLKMQEMAGAAAFSFNPMEFRHGPWGSVTDDDVVVLLGQRSRRRYEKDLFHDLIERQARVVPVAPASWFDGLREISSESVKLPDVIPDIDGGPLAVVPLQLLAWRLALLNGHDPDAPRNLNAVVVLKP